MPKFKIIPQNGLIICHIKLSGKRRTTFLKMALDTGASRTIIPPEAALSIGANPAHAKKTTEITTGSGCIICPIVTIPKFLGFGIVRKNMQLVCHTLPSESPVDGLLGLDFFKGTTITINLKKNFLEVKK